MTDFQLEPIEDVLEQSGVRPTKHYANIASGVWTRAVKVGRQSFWPRHETQALIAARIAGADDEQMRSLVRSLHEQRRALMPRLEAPAGATAGPEAAA
jgi:prophage regulatory protein